jgi:DNA (cytosine-5)-methyltransferase 1
MPRVLDLFCGAGGAGTGYHRAGCDVVGVDIKHQPRYPFDFVQLDALDALDALLPDGRGGSWCLSDFDAIHASPPCQASTSLRALNPGRDYPELIPATRELLIASGLPYVIENVVGAKLINPVMLCGSSMGLRVRRHRLFETNFPVMVPGCAHGLERPEFPIGLGSPTNSYRKRMGFPAGRLSPVAYVYGSTRYPGDLVDRKRAMGIDWMTNAELTQAIPPAYTELIGGFLLAELNHRTERAA